MSQLKKIFYKMKYHWYIEQEKNYLECMKLLNIYVGNGNKKKSSFIMPSGCVKKLENLGPNRCKGFRGF